MQLFERRVDMAFLKILVNVGLIFTIATALPVDGDSENNLNAVNYRLPDNVVPVHYDIELIPHLEENDFTFDGKVHVTIKIIRATRDLSLHAKDLTINETATSLISSDIAYAPVAHNYDNETEILTLHFDDELPPEIYSLNIQFVGILNDNSHGFFRASYVNEEEKEVWLAATHFEACNARRAFPCWDEPALKATFNISMKHRQNYTAVSNMPIWYQSNDENDMMWTHFLTTPVMSTYLVAFVVSDYVRVPNADETLNMWCRSAVAPHSKFAQEIAEKARVLLTEYTNSTDKVPKMDHLAVPDLAGAGAMENWGLIIYMESGFKYNEKEDSLHHKQEVATVAAHEMAHQWFGNVVSPLWWSDVWLNEGFASYFEEYILNEIMKDWRVMDFFVVKTVQNGLHMDIAKMVKPITFEANTRDEIETLFSFNSYGKGPAILRMVQHTITAEVFRKGIIKYLHKHQFSSATSDDLWSSLQTALDESDVPHNAYRLKDVMDTWLKQRHYPLVHVKRNYDTNETILTQEHYYSRSQNQSVDNDKWWIPLTFVTQTNPDFSNTVPTHWLTPQDENISIDEIDPNDWIIVNVQQMGYYRVNYDDSNWRRLAKYLNSDDYTKIHVLNRVQIIDDAYHLMQGEQLGIEIFLDVANYLSRETDFIALYSMFNRILIEMDELIQIPEANYFKQYILHILDKLIENVGYEEDPAENDLTKLKRYNILKWACTYGHSECKRIASIKLDEYFENPETHRMSWEIEDWTYNYGIMQANASTWNKLMDIYFIDQDEETLDYLTSAEDLDILINFINISVSNDTIIQNNHNRYIIFDIIGKHSNKDAVIDYILANLETIAPSRDFTLKIIHRIIMNMKSHEQLDKISDFVKNNFQGEQADTFQETIENQKSRLAKLTSIANKLFSKFLIKEDETEKQS